MRCASRIFINACFSDRARVTQTSRSPTIRCRPRLRLGLRTDRRRLRIADHDLSSVTLPNDLAASPAVCVVDVVGCDRKTDGIRAEIAIHRRRPTRHLRTLSGLQPDCRQCQRTQNIRNRAGITEFRSTGRLSPNRNGKPLSIVERGGGEEHYRVRARA